MCDAVTKHFNLGEEYETRCEQQGTLCYYHHKIAQGLLEPSMQSRGANPVAIMDGDDILWVKVVASAE